MSLDQEPQQWNFRDGDLDSFEVTLLESLAEGVLRRYSPTKVVRSHELSDDDEYKVVFESVTYEKPQGNREQAHSDPIEHDDDESELAVRLFDESGDPFFRLRFEQGKPFISGDPGREVGVKVIAIAHKLMESVPLSRAEARVIHYVRGFGFRLMGLDFDDNDKTGDQYITETASAISDIVEGAATGQEQFTSFETTFDTEDALDLRGYRLTSDSEGGSSAANASPNLIVEYVDVVGSQSYLFTVACGQGELDIYSFAPDQFSSDSNVNELERTSKGRKAMELLKAKLLDVGLEATLSDSD
jgi:hypothetical protein